MSLISGPLSGLRSGLRSGLNPSLGGLVGVSSDTLSGKYVPADNTEWTAVKTATGIPGNPSSLWLCQGISMTDAIGAVTLTQSGTVTYQNAVTGWSRKSVNIADGAPSTGWNTTSYGNLATTSGLLLAYVAITGTPAAERELMGIGSSTDHRYVAVTATPRYKAAGLAGASVTGTGTLGTTVRPVVLMVNRATSTFKVYTDQEALGPAWTNPTAGGSLLQIGDAIPTGTPPVAYLYIAFFSGSAAELTDSQVRTLLQTLNWTVAW